MRAAVNAEGTRLPFAPRHAKTVTMLRSLLPTLLVATSFAFNHTLFAGPSAITMRVEEAIKSEMGKATRGTRVQHRAFNVYLTNNSNNDMQVTVRRAIFGRDTLTRKVVTVVQTDYAATVKSGATEKVEIPTATATSIDAHFDTKTKKLVPASGATIVGYGVQVLAGSELLDESYDPPSMKEEWGKAPPLTAPGAAKPAATKPAAPTKPAK